MAITIKHAGTWFTPKWQDIEAKEPMEFRLVRQNPLALNSLARANGDFDFGFYVGRIVAEVKNPIELDVDGVKKPLEASDVFKYSPELDDLASELFMACKNVQDGEDQTKN